MSTSCDGLCPDAESSLQKAHLAVTSSEESLSMGQATVSSSACDTTWKVIHKAGRASGANSGRLKTESFEQRAKTWESGDMDSLPGAAVKLLCNPKQAAVSIVKIKPVRLKYDMFFAMSLIQ